jgi:hypothetical protein
MGCPFSIVAELGTRTLEMESKALTTSESAGLAILIGSTHRTLINH